MEGDSGLINVIPPQLVADYNRSFHEIKLINGSLIKGIPASEPERFRGGQWHGAWCCTPGTKIWMADGSSKPIENIVVGDMVMTRHGKRKVLASSVSGNTNDLVRMDCGVTSLTITSDHPILVGDQWIPAGNIKIGDQVWVATSALTANMPTESYTNSIMEPYLKGGLCTTGTKIKPITIRPISWQCLGETITASIQQVELDRRSKSLPRPKPLPRFVSQSLQRAFIAAKDLYLALLEKLESFAPRIALRNGEITDSYQSKEIALFADQSTQPSNDFKSIAAELAMASQLYEPIALKQMGVLRAERLPNSLTYNLTVEGEHEFIANGVVVHNCDELAAWDYLQEAWDQIQFSVRLGKQTRILCTTTPRPKDLIVDLVGRDGDDVCVTTASTYMNLANLAPSFQKQILQYEGTKLGRQEIYAEIIDPEESGIIKRDMIKLWPSSKEFPKFEYILQSYDVATSEKTVNDPTAATTWGVFKPLDGPMSVLLIDCWQDRLQYPDLRPKVLDEYEVVYGEGRERKRVDLILIEDKSAGISLIQDLQRAHLPVRAYNPGRADKMQRLNVISSLFARGRVWMPESTQRPRYVKDWVEPLLSQLCAFPDTTHDDFVDSTSQALRFLRDAGWIDIDGPAPELYDEDDYYDSGMSKRKENPYAV
jgi:predicted phage terminase large subunit-like protein